MAAAGAVSLLTLYKIMDENSANKRSFSSSLCFSVPVVKAADDGAGGAGGAADAARVAAGCTAGPSAGAGDGHRRQSKNKEQYGQKHSFHRKHLLFFSVSSIPPPLTARQMRRAALKASICRKTEE
jgi:hypothetical protein